MSKQPKVTISIPTYNSAKFIERCLNAVNNQTYDNIEVNLVDADSKDKTREMAKALGVKDIVICKDALLKARYEGVKIADGDFVLLLDSDQVLEPDAIERAIAMISSNKLDMLVFEEDVYQVKNWLEKLFQLDRKLIHHVKDFNPYTSVMLPRFYKTTLLTEAFKEIPTEALNNVGGQDHAIIYFEAWHKSKRVDLLPHAVKHIEPNSLRVMVKKFYRWGGTSQAAHHERYNEMLEKKERFRKGMFAKGMYAASLASIVLLLIKGLPYYAGLTVKRLRK